MIKAITSAAHRIDAWLRSRLGLKYRLLLTAGLVADIGHRIVDTPKQIAAHHHLVGIILAVVLEFGLLIHQVAEIDERLEQRMQPKVKD